MNEFYFFVSTIEGFVQESYNEENTLSEKIDIHFEEIESELHKGFILPMKILKTFPHSLKKSI